MAISVINFAGLIIERDGKVALARIALGALAPRVVRAKAAESYLEGNELTREIASIAAKLSTEAASPIDDIRATADYRSRMLVRLLEWELFKLAD
jgi:CO/xanthine dehydrogenase FAD-binding subunit